MQENTLITSAIALHEVYISFLKAGFTKEQSFQLLRDGINTEMKDEDK